MTAHWLTHARGHAMTRSYRFRFCNVPPLPFSKESA